MERVEFFPVSRNELNLAGEEPAAMPSILSDIERLVSPWSLGVKTFFVRGDVCVVIACCKVLVLPDGLKHLGFRL